MGLGIDACKIQDGRPFSWAPMAAPEWHSPCQKLDGFSWLDFIEAENTFGLTKVLTVALRALLGETQGGARRAHSGQSWLESGDG
jgi:hypothetical protein